MAKSYIECTTCIILEAINNTINMKLLHFFLMLLFSCNLIAADNLIGIWYYIDNDTIYHELHIDSNRMMLCQEDTGCDLFLYYYDSINNIYLFNENESLVTINYKIIENKLELNYDDKIIVYHRIYCSRLLNNNFQFASKSEYELFLELLFARGIKFKQIAFNIDLDTIWLEHISDTMKSIILAPAKRSLQLR